MKLSLLQYGGEFCTRRTSPALPVLLKILSEQIERGVNLRTKHLSK